MRTITFIVASSQVNVFNHTICSNLPSQTHKYLHTRAAKNRTKQKGVMLKKGVEVWRCSCAGCRDAYNIRYHTIPIAPTMMMMADDEMMEIRRISSTR